MYSWILIKIRFKNFINRSKYIITLQTINYCKFRTNLSLYRREFCQVFFFFWIFNSTIIKFICKSFRQIYSKLEFNSIFFMPKQVTVIRNVIRNPALGLISRMSRWISISSARWTISVFDSWARYFVGPREGLLQKKPRDDSSWNMQLNLSTKSIKFEIV